MPYIDEETKYKLDHQVDGVQRPMNPGELNYVIIDQLLIYLADKGETYQTYNDIIGVLECAKLELYRRKITPYEEEKKQINGDVF